MNGNIKAMTERCEGHPRRCLSGPSLRARSAATEEKKTGGTHVVTDLLRAMAVETS